MFHQIAVAPPFRLVAHVEAPVRGHQPRVRHDGGVERVEVEQEQEIKDLHL